MFTLAVTGGRNYTNRQKVFTALDKVHAKRPITLLIHGAARGADTLCSKWARERGIRQKAFYADWDRYGRSAGHRRNRDMLDRGKPDGVIAFPGGRGTTGMVNESNKRKITIWQPYK